MNRIWAPALILGTAIAAHWGAIHGGAVEAEDYVRMFSGSVHAGWQGWSKLFSPDYFREFNSGLYRPLQSVYFYLSWICFGSKIELYQWSKIALLWGSACFVFQLGVGILKDKFWALLAALLYISHPSQTGALLYVGKTEDLLMVLFSLITLYCHWQGRLKARHQSLWILATGAGFTLALAAKETAIVLPGCLILFDALDLSRSAEAGRRARFWRPYIALFFLAAAYLAALAWIGQETYGVLGLAGERPFWKPAVRLAAHVASLWWFPPPGRNVVSAVFWVLGALALIGMLAFDWFSGASRRALFLGGWIILALLPVLNVFSAGSLTGYLAQPAIQPWRLLLPAVGFCWLASVCLQRLSVRSGLVSCGLSILWLCGQFADSHALATEHREHYADVVIRGDDLRAGSILKNSRFYGVMLSLPYMRRRQPEMVREISSCVMRRLPRHSGPTIVDLFSQDLIYQDTQVSIRVLEALSHKGFEGFHRELAHLEQEDPGGDSAARFAGRLGEAARLKDVGVELFREGRTADSIGVLERSLALNPDNLYTLLSLASIRLTIARPEQALAPLDHALELQSADDPLRAEILGARAQALRSLGRSREAAEDQRAAAQLLSSGIKGWQ